MVRKGFIKKGALESPPSGGKENQPGGYLGEEISGQWGSRMCKGPEAGACLLCLSKNKEANKASPEGRGDDCVTLPQVCRAQWRRRHGEETCGRSGGRRGWDELRRWH